MAHNTFMPNMTNFKKLIELLFPSHITPLRRTPNRQTLLLFLAAWLVASGLSTFIPADGFYAFDWLIFFGAGNVPRFYPPWTGYLVQILTWPTITGLTIATLFIASYLRASHSLSLACALLTWPALWTLFLGQIDGVVLLGVTFLPWLATLALIKPQVAIFAFLARPAHLLALMVTLLGSFIIWGFWPQNILDIMTTIGEAQYAQDIAIGWVGLPVALVLLWFSRGDEDMLMLAGMCATPYLIPYSMIVVSPAVARLPIHAAIMACLLSWTSLSSQWLGPMGWWLGWTFVAWLWVHLALMRYPHTRPARWLQAQGWLPTP